MTDVLEELTTGSLSRDHVERRLDDWNFRLRDLYARIASWLEPDLSWEAVVVENAVRIDADLMRESGVPPQTFPALALVKAGEPHARVEPRGLWVVGTNGRLDLAVGLDHYMIVDAAENFAEPRWMFTPSLDRTIRKPFVAEQLLAIL